MPYVFNQKGQHYFVKQIASYEFCKECLDKWFNAKKLSRRFMSEKNIEYFKYHGNIHRIVCIIQTEQPLHHG